MQQSDVTELLIAWGRGDGAALDRLVPLVEAELRAVARRYINQENPGHTLQPTALVNEAFIRLIEWKSVDWQNRAHFLAVASKMMRRILVTHAVRRQRDKRGGRAVMVSLSDASSIPGGRDADLLALDEALDRLAAFDARKSQLVELRFFGGLSEQEAAEVLQSSVRTVQREWSLARAWLFRELSS